MKLKENCKMNCPSSAIHLLRKSFINCLLTDTVESNYRYSTMFMLESDTDFFDVFRDIFSEEKRIIRIRTKIFEKHVPILY